MERRKGIKAFSLLLAALMVLCVAPQTSLAAMPDYLEISEKSGFTSQTATVPNLSDGQVWVTRTASSEQFLPTAAVTLSAIGQAYNAPETNLVPNNVVFVLDVSTSMQTNDKATTMAISANAAMEALCINGNKLAVVTFGEQASVQRALSTDAFTLTTTDETGDDIINVYPKTSVGTNVQAGLNQAYKILQDAKNAGDDASPIIILLTDGAPTYYYESVSTSNVTTSDRKGSGSSTDNNHIGRTIIQAAYLKVLMPDLRIYTIGFDTAGNASANVTLNPTPENITAYGNNLSSSLTSFKNSVPSASRAAINYNYASGAYNASNSTSSLNSALNAIVRGIRVSKPVLESKDNPTDTTLTDESYVTLKDKIGQNFVLGSNVTVSYMGASYPFTYNSSTGKITYNTAINDVGYNPEMARLVITYSTSSRTLTWKIPGNTLPCKDPGGTGNVQPISLTYNIALEGENLTEGVYNTSSSFTVDFTPSPDNPCYSDQDVLSKDTYTNTNQATYYTALFPSGTDSGSRQLWTLGTGSSLAGMTYRQFPTNAATYRNLTPAYINVTLDNGTVLKMTPIEDLTASAKFYTSNMTNVDAYSVSSNTFKIGSTYYNDADVTAIEYVRNGVYNITVTYNGGKYSLVFPSVSISNRQTTSKYTLNFKKASGSELQQGFVYDANLNRITLKLDSSSQALIFRETVSSSTTTLINANAAANEYTIKQTTINADGTQTLTVYLLTSSSITKTVSTVVPSGDVSNSGETSGSMIVKSNAIIGEISLKAENGTATAVADKAGQAVVVLTFTSKDAFRNFNFTLSSAKGSTVDAFSGYAVVSVSSSLTRNADGSFNADTAGTHTVTLLVTNPYTPVPDSFKVYLEGVSYKTKAGNDKSLPHATNYANQKVKVVLKSPSRH